MAPYRKFFSSNSKAYIYLHTQYIVLIGSLEKWQGSQASAQLLSLSSCHGFILLTAKKLPTKNHFCGCIHPKKVCITFSNNFSSLSQQRSLSKRRWSRNSISKSISQRYISTYFFFRMVDNFLIEVCFTSRQIQSNRDFFSQYVRAVY